MLDEGCQNVRQTDRQTNRYSKTSFEKKTEYGFDQQRLIWYVCRLLDMVFSRRFER